MTDKKIEKLFWASWTFLATAIVVACLSSCVTKDRCNRKYPPEILEHYVTKDSIITCYDTTYLKGDSVIINDSIPCPDFYSHVNSGGLDASVSISNGHLQVICKADSLQKIIEKQTHYIKELKETTIKPQPIEVKVSHWYDKYIFRPTGTIFMLLLLLWVVLKTLKK